MGERVIDIEGILKRLPHAFPFVMLDRVLEIGEKDIVAYKNVTYNEWFFQGHFPGHPVMPGVLIVEGLAQTGAIMLFENMDLPEDIVMYFMTIDKVKFRKPVTPGDKLVYKVEALHQVEDPARPRAKFDGKAYVGEQVVAEAIMTAIGAKREV